MHYLQEWLGTVEPLSGEVVRNYLQLSLLSAGLLALISTIWWQADQESYEEQTEDYPVMAFDKVGIWGTLNVLITAGPAYTMTARGPRRAIRSIRVRQRGKRLEIGSRFLFWHHQRDLLLTITAPNLNKLDVSGACIVQMNGFRELNSLDLDVTGASNVSVEGEAHYVTVDVTGASKLTLVGKGTRLRANITGASTLHAFEYQVDDADIDVTGACNAQLCVTRLLKAEATGASQVRYQGEPSVQFESAGASSIKRV